MRAIIHRAVVRTLLLGVICLATESSAQADADSARRIQMRGFSIVPPPGSGWAIRKKSSDGIFFFDIARSKRDHTLLAWVELVSLDGLAAASDSPQIFAKSVEASMKTPEDRFRVLEAEAIPYRAHGTDCLQIRRVGEESGNRQFPGVLFIETRAGFICRHPRDPRMGVMAAHSERRPSGATSYLDESLRKKVEEFLLTVLFVPIQ